MITKSSDLIFPSGNSVVILGFDEIVSDSIRMELYKTSYTFENLNISDIGNLIDNSLESITGSFQKLSAQTLNIICLLYTSDAADERSSVDLGGRRIIKKKNRQDHRGYDMYYQYKHTHK